MTATIGAAFLNFLLQTLYAKNLEINDYGKVSLYLSFISIIMPIVGAGLPSFWIKADAKDELEYWIKPSINFLCYTFLFSVLIQLIFIVFYVKEDFIAYILFSTFIFSQISIDLINSINLINKHTGQYIFWRIFSASVRLLLFLLLIVFDQVTITNIGLLYLVTGIIPLIKIIKIIKNTIYSSDAKVKKYSSYDVLKNCWMYSASGVLYLIYLQSNVVLASKYFSLESAALFNVPVLIITVALMFPNIVFQKFFAPDLNNWFYNDREKFTKFFRKANLIMFLIGMFFSITLYSLSPFLVIEFFGEKFRNSIELIRVLTFLIPFAFLTSGFSSVHIKKSDLKVKVLIMFLMALIHLVVVYFIKDIFGIMAFAYTTVMSYISVSILFYLSSKRIIKHG
jgi:O-antigen/teichoic acid export membrane protein